MLADWTTLVGTSAAILTTASYIPQVRKTWSTGETGDLSRNMLLILASGLALSKVNTEPGSKGKTSDRTPGTTSPNRTPNASSTGNTGTDVGQTHEGTSDRTPKK